jgi:hypothetical protein
VRLVEELDNDLGPEAQSARPAAGGSRGPARAGVVRISEVLSVSPEEANCRSSIGS